MGHHNSWFNVAWGTLSTQTRAIYNTFKRAMGFKAVACCAVCEGRGTISVIN